MSTNATHLFEQDELNQTIWRYMSLSKYLNLITTHKLFFSRYDKLGDPFEGRPSDSEIQKWYENNGSKLAARYKLSPSDYKYYYFANCWTKQTEENFLLWKQYESSNMCIAIRSTIQKLCDSFASSKYNIFVGNVRYFEDPDIKKSELLKHSTLLFRKRGYYADEKEVRAVFFDSLFGDISLNSNRHIVDAPKYFGIGVEINLKTLLEKIVVSPGSKPSFIDDLNDITRKYCGSDFSVSPSSIDELP